MTRTSLSSRHWLSALVTGAILVWFGTITLSRGDERHPRLAAEWEPALGALIVWPPNVPDSLLVEIARDDRLFLIVADQEEKTEAESTLKDLGIDPGSVDLIIDDTVGWHIWTRDWGPSALFDRNGDFHLVDPKFVDYPMSMPDCTSLLYSMSPLSLFWELFGGAGGEDDPTAVQLARTLGVSRLELPYALTGGNALVDGLGTMFSTCVMLNENKKYLGLGEKKFFSTVKPQLGIDNYIIVPNFEWFGIQHIDCLLKPLDEERLLVKRVPEGHPDHEPIEEIVETLSRLTNPYGRPYRIHRIDTPP